MERAYWSADDSETLFELTVGQLLGRSAQHWPDRVALVTSPDDSPRIQWTYHELYEVAVRAAQALLACFEPGDHIAVWSPNRPEWVILEFAAGLAGLVLVTVNPAFREKEFEYVVRQSRSRGLFLVSEHRGNPMLAHLEAVRDSLPALEHVFDLADWEAFLASADPGLGLPEVSATAAAQIQYTSGTTGFPKGALLSHRGIVNNARLVGQRLEISGDGGYLNYMPLFHTGGCVVGTLVPIWSGIPQVLMGGFDPEQALRLIEEERCEMLGGVPTMLIALLETAAAGTYDLGSLRTVWTGGATVSPELVRRIEGELDVQLSIVFGQTETSPTITQTRLSDSPEDKANTVGQPLPCTEVKVVDPDRGGLVGVGEPGELCTRGYLTMNGYFDLPEATADTIDAEGWLHTGDLCAMDERGYVQVTGRLKDLIIRGGENIYPKEIEEVLFTHESVAEAAVVGVADDRWGEQPVAFIRPAKGAEPDADELFAYVRERLAPHKTPRHWRFVNELPTTPSGKIQKFVLREQFESQSDLAGADIVD